MNHHNELANNMTCSEKEADAISCELHQPSQTVKVSSHLHKCLAMWIARLSDAIRREPMRRLNYDEVQWRVDRWIHRAFGRECAGNLSERVMRVLEEALELAQSEGLPAEAAAQLVAYVYHRPVGEPTQEAAGVSVTLLAYAAAKKISLGETTVRKIARIEEPHNLAAIRRKQLQKLHAGIAMPDRRNPCFLDQSIQRSETSR